ncbi:unnamed protein product [Symbiodinium sp. CCMP2456]|nr:unnamed protein product [Symbiodinium sp. CCMP2456]
MLGVVACTKTLWKTSFASSQGASSSALLEAAQPGLRSLPSDLDAFSPGSMTREMFLNAVAAQIMLFAGFSPTSGRWLRAPARRSFSQRVESIQPTWKGGQVDYSPDATDASGGLPLFRIANSGQTALNAGSTVGSMLASLVARGLRDEDLDSDAWQALRAMLSWRLPDAAPPPLPSALLAFSFDATPQCHSLQDCSLPGPSNELLAATVEHVWNTSERVEVYAQWEIAAALLRSGRIPPGRIHPAGVPGRYMNTVQILEAMMQDILQQQPAAQSLVVLAHPDHLRRAIRTLQTFLGSKARTFPAWAVVPAMAPYSLDWPSNRSCGSALDLYSGVSAMVHSQGREFLTSWWAGNLGYFPDGDPQIWVHNREVWVLYDHWAMAKGEGDEHISAIFRNPLDHVYSLYLQCRYSSFGHDMTLETDFPRDPEENLTSGYMPALSRWLEHFTSEDTEEYYNCLANMRSLFFVGISEHYVASVCMLLYQLQLEMTNCDCADQSAFQSPDCLARRVQALSPKPLNSLTPRPLDPWTPEPPNS